MLQKRRIVVSVNLLLFVLFITVSQSQAMTRHKRTIENYQVPDVVLVNQDGKRLSLRALVNSDKPVFLDFIYGTCTTICPILSIGFSHFQEKLGKTAENVQLLSISIDPDNDTPQVMKEYLNRYNARPGWDYLSGNRTDIIKVMRAFDAFVTNKMDHRPLTILHAPGTDTWIRINGLMGTSELMEEYKKLLEK